MGRLLYSAPEDGKAGTGCIPDRGNRTGKDTGAWGDLRGACWRSANSFLSSEYRMHVGRSWQRTD